MDTYMHKTLASIGSLEKIEIIRMKMIIIGPKTAILGPQFCRILVLGPHFWWSGGPGPPGPPWFSSYIVFAPEYPPDSVHAKCKICTHFCINVLESMVYNVAFCQNLSENTEISIYFNMFSGHSLKWECQQ